MKMKVHFLNRDCALVCARYPNGRVAIKLVSDAAPVATATVNVPSCPLGEREVLIKNYDENKGVLDALIEAGVVRPTNVFCQVGHARAQVCDLLIEPPTVH